LFKKEQALLGGVVPKSLQAHLRRKARARYLLWDARKYNAWLAGHLEARRAQYQGSIQPGLLSVVTPVWDGTPLRYLRPLADSIIAQNDSGACEWLLLNNGCKSKELLDYFETLKVHRWIVVRESAENSGIIGGLRQCLQKATGRYILPVDSDDWLYPDCLQVVNAWIEKCDYPPILYTDEDKVIGKQAVQPYFKPDFDPVLLLNSAYIAHLGVLDRKLALELDGYGDKSTEGSPDWDLFLRFAAAGYSAVHIPEVVYSWRMHPESTADDSGSKPYIYSSQKAVLQRYLDAKGMAETYTVEYSPLLKGTADWWLKRKQIDARTAALISLTTGAAVKPQPLEYAEVRRESLAMSAPLSELRRLLDDLTDEDEALVCLVVDDLQIHRRDWLWDALGIMELHPDTMMVGGRVLDQNNVIQSAGYVLGFGGDCACPDRGRPAVDPGYFTQVLKQRSVSAVSSRFTVFTAGSLRQLLDSGIPALATIPFLGAWAGAYALRKKKRVAYSPYLSAVSELDWDALPNAEERELFREVNIDILPDQRFYPRYFGLQPDAPYTLS
jgi:glycosyltransferase involved in cell wall biosynthesis